MTSSRCNARIGTLTSSRCNAELGHKEVTKKEEREERSSVSLCQINPRTIHAENNGRKLSLLLTSRWAQRHGPYDDSGTYFKPHFIPSFLFLICTFPTTCSLFPTHPTIPYPPPTPLSPTLHKTSALQVVSFGGIISA